jgi:D-apiose dehydrogenase
MKAPVLRVGMIGAGMISRYHLLGWSRLPNVTVVAICDPDEPRAASRAREFRIASVYADARAMVDREALDALDIASPRETHAAMVRLAAARGLAALCQKPLTPTLAEAEALVAEIGAQIRLMVHENWRFRPAYRRIKQWLEIGRIGELRAARMLVRGSGLLRNDKGEYPALTRQPFMRDVPRLAVSESLIHQIDVMRWLIGPMRVLGARLGRICPEVAGEDRATIMLASDDGAPVVVDGDMAAPGYPPRTSDLLELTGTRGTILFKDMRLSLMGSAHESVSFDPEESYQASFDDCIRHFVSCLETGAPFETNPQDNLETLRLVEDTYRLAGPVRTFQCEQAIG